jgi:hypothetical protein
LGWPGVLSRAALFLVPADVLREEAGIVAVDGESAPPGARCGGGGRALWGVVGVP